MRMYQFDVAPHLTRRTVRASLLEYLDAQSHFADDRATDLPCKEVIPVSTEPMAYEPPALVEVGDFNELTRGTAFLILFELGTPPLDRLFVL